MSAPDTTSPDDPIIEAFASLVAVAESAGELPLCRALGHLEILWSVGGAGIAERRLQDLAHTCRRALVTQKEHPS